MQLNDSELKKLIEAVIAMLKAQNMIVNEDTAKVSEKLKNVFVLFTAPWDNRFYTFTQSLQNIKNCQFSALLSPNLSGEEAARLQTLANWQMIATWEDAHLKNLENSTSIFPVMSRDTIVKSALCIADTFETKWIKNAMEQGGSIILPRSGFERFTGRESEKYKQKILSYYRDLLEMNIELPESFEKYIG